MLKQRTLSSIVKASGIGLHTGEKVQIALRPAAQNTGIIFRRIDLDPVQQIKALAENVIDTTLGTSIGNNNASIMTVEHLLAAFAGLGIDNVLVVKSGLINSHDSPSSVDLCKCCEPT